MKGKIDFTQQEANEIKALIRKKLVANKQEQKQIRDQIRSIGFYSSDFTIPRRKGGYNLDDFLNHVNIKS